MSHTSCACHIGITRSAASLTSVIKDYLFFPLPGLQTSPAPAPKTITSTVPDSSLQLRRVLHICTGNTFCQRSIPRDGKFHRLSRKGHLTHRRNRVIRSLTNGPDYTRLDIHFPPYLCRSKPHLVLSPDSTRAVRLKSAITSVDNTYLSDFRSITTKLRSPGNIANESNARTFLQAVSIVSQGTPSEWWQYAPDRKQFLP